MKLKRIVCLVVCFVLLTTSVLADNNKGYPDFDWSIIRANIGEPREDVKKMIIGEIISPVNGITYYVYGNNANVNDLVIREYNGNYGYYHAYASTNQRTATGYPNLNGGLTSSPIPWISGYVSGEEIPDKPEEEEIMPDLIPLLPEVDMPEGDGSPLLKAIITGINILINGTNIIISIINKISSILMQILSSLKSILLKFDELLVLLKKSMSLESIGNNAKALVVPDENYLDGEFNKMKNNFENKVGISSNTANIKNAFDVENLNGKFSGIHNMGAIVKGNNLKIGNTTLGANVNGSIYFNMLDTSFLLKYIEDIRGWVSAFFFMLCLIYNYNQLYKLIRGVTFTNATMGSSSSPAPEPQPYNPFKGVM